MRALLPHTSFVYGETFAYRWGGAALAGKWLAAWSFGSPSGPYFVHANCVVDDFGTLVPVSVFVPSRIEVLW